MGELPAVDDVFSKTIVIVLSKKSDKIKWITLFDICKKKEKENRSLV